MPSKKYCECGAVTEYGSTVPRFCSGCGASFEAFATTKKPQSRQPAAPQPALPDDDSDGREDDIQIPRLGKLEVDFLDSPRKMTVADIAFQRPSTDRKS